MFLNSFSNLGVRIAVVVGVEREVVDLPANFISFLFLGNDGRVRVSVGDVEMFFFDRGDALYVDGIGRLFFLLDTRDLLFCVVCHVVL